MTFSKILLAGTASLALISCGDGGAGTPNSKTSAAASDIEKPSPLDSTFKMEAAAQADIAGLFDLFGEDAQISYDDIVLDSATGATVVSNLTFSDQEGDLDDKIVIERAEFYGVDEAAIETVIAAEDAGPDAPFEKVFEKVRLLNLRSEGLEDEDGNFANLSIGGVEFDRLEIRHGGGVNPDGDEGASMLNAFTLGGFYLKGLAFETADEQAQLGVNATVPDLRVVGLAGGKVDAVLAKDLSYGVDQGGLFRKAMLDAMGPQAGMLFDGPIGTLIAPEKQTVSMARFEWRDIDLSGLVKYGLKNETPPASDRDLIDLGAIRLSGLTSFINGKEAVKAADLEIPAMKFSWSIPSDIRFEANGIVTDYTAYLEEDEGEAFALLKEHGLDKVVSNGSGAWSWNPDNGFGSLRYNSDADGLADFNMSFEMESASLKEIAALQKESDGNSQDDHFGDSFLFKSLSIELDDDAMLDTVFALSALQMGGSGDDLRQTAPAMIRLGGAQFTQGNPRLRDYVDAFADFVAEGGSIVITAAPDEPLNPAKAIEAAGPMAAPDILNLSVTHKAPDGQ